MPPAQDDEQPPALNSPAREGLRFPPALQTRDNVPKAVWPIVQTSPVIFPLLSGTIVSLPPAAHRPLAQHPRSPSLSRFRPRSAAAHLVLPRRVDLVRTMAPAQTNPNAASEVSSQPPSSERCDRHFEFAQYTSEQFQKLMSDHGVVCSMSRSGNVWDNAAMESFFSSLKTERTARKTYRTRDQAKADVFDYIECFYNPKRRHSTIGYLSPVEFERQAGISLGGCQLNRVQARKATCKGPPAVGCEHLLAKYQPAKE